MISENQGPKPKRVTFTRNSLFPGFSLDGEDPEDTLPPVSASLSPPSLVTPLV